VSFSLAVLAPTFSDDLGPRWSTELARHGLLVEFYPGFKPSTWRGGFLPFMVKVQSGAFPTAARYGSDPLLGGFELDFGRTDAEELAEVAAEEQVPAVAALLESCRVEAVLSTSMGRTVLDLRLQSFAAATLAIVARGLVMDGQQGKSFVGAEAVANAARESDLFDAQPIHEADWDLVPFPGWQALEPAG